eukprot:13957322-Alexandrium_andersonii.AAC.1
MSVRCPFMSCVVCACVPSMARRNCPSDGRSYSLVCPKRCKKKRIARFETAYNHVRRHQPLLTSV